jgi:hypothetical protein
MNVNTLQQFALEGALLRARCGLDRLFSPIYFLLLRMKHRFSCALALTALSAFIFGRSLKGQESETSRSPRDLEAKRALAKTVIAELEAGQFDLLESQYRDFKTQTQPDGTPKVWVYFWAFDHRKYLYGSNAEEKGKLLTQKAQEWLKEKPDSVPALLVLWSSLFGECTDILRDKWEAADLGSRDPKAVTEIQARIDEFRSSHERFPVQAIAVLEAEPQYYVANVQFFSFLRVKYELFEHLDHDLEHYDPYYSPFYLYGCLWLANRRVKDPGLPRPEVWLTDHFEPTALDSEEDRIRKCRAYAQTITSNVETGFQFRNELLDWPTLKTGLQDLVRIYGPETNWPTLYLVYAYAHKDKEAAREALSVIRGNYATEIVTNPLVFQDISKWAEEDIRRMDWQ